MSHNGPQSEIVFVIEDSNGTQFRYSTATLLGKGVGGETYLARIIEPGRSNFELGQEVALKKLPIIAPPSSKEEEKDYETAIRDRNREIDVLKREGTLLSLIAPPDGDASEHTFLALPFFPGTDLRNAMYLHKGPTGNEAPVGKKPFSKDIANVLLHKVEGDSLEEADKHLIATSIAGESEYDLMLKIKTTPELAALNSLISIEPIDSNAIIGDIRQLVESTYPEIRNNNRKVEAIVHNLIRTLPLLNALTLDRSLSEREKSVLKKNINKNTALSNAQRDAIAYSLVRDFFIMQQLGITHCDIKPDNILVDAQSGTAKIIDMGQAFISSESPHLEFQGPGVLYSPPETDLAGGRKTPNSTQTDIYSLGMVLASLYSDRPYEVEADANLSVMENRKIMDDVLSNKKKLHIPYDLIEIIQDCTQVTPSDRPHNIAMTEGVAHSEELNDLYQIQSTSEKFISNLAISLDPKLVRAKEILTSSRDLPSIQRQLQSLLSSGNLTRIEKKEFPGILQSLQDFSENQMRNLQKRRLGHTPEYLERQEVTTHIVLQLQAEAEKYRRTHKHGMIKMMSRHKGDYNTVGNSLITASRKIQNHNDIEAVLTELKHIYSQMKDIKRHHMKDHKYPEIDNSLALIKNIKKSISLRLEKSSSPSSKKVRFT